MTAPPSSASAGREGGQPSARPLHDFSTRKCTLPRLRDVEKGFRHGEGSACRAAAPLMKSPTSSSSMSRSDVLPGLSFDSYVYAGGRVWGGLLRGRKDRRSAPTTRRPYTQTPSLRRACAFVCGNQGCGSVHRYYHGVTTFKNVVLRTMDVVLPGLRVRSAAAMSFPPKTWSFSGFTTSLSGRFGMRPRGRAPSPARGVCCSQMNWECGMGLA